MSERFSEEDLLKKGFVRDGAGVFVPAPKKPRGVEALFNQATALEVAANKKVAEIEASMQSGAKLRRLSLCLFGIPMPKQSVRGYATGRKNDKGTLIVDHFQPQKTVDRKKDYIRQIREQLPADFKMFETEVHVTKFHCVYPPLKAFSKVKGKMDAIRNGTTFYKNSRPDLIDNLKKLAFDSLGGLVIKDDSIIVTENNTAKYFGMGGMIIIELEGY